jgi:hypothetical protein
MAVARAPAKTTVLEEINVTFVTFTRTSFIIKVERDGCLQAETSPFSCGHLGKYSHLLAPLH